MVQIATESELIGRSEAFEQAMNENALAQFCDYKVANSAGEDQETWLYLRILFEADPKRHVSYLQPMSCRLTIWQSLPWHIVVLTLVLHTSMFYIYMLFTECPQVAAAQNLLASFGSRSLSPEVMQATHDRIHLLHAAPEVVQVRVSLCRRKHWQVLMITMQTVAGEAGQSGSFATVPLHQKALTAAHDTCRQLLENLGFHNALPPEPLAEPSTLSSVDAAAQSLEDVHLHNASLAGGDGFGDGLSPHGEDNGDFFEQQGTPAGHSETCIRWEWTAAKWSQEVLCSSYLWALCEKHVNVEHACMQYQTEDNNVSR